MMMADALNPAKSPSTGLDFATVAALLGTVGETEFAGQLASIFKSVADFDGSSAYLVRKRGEREEAVQLWAFGTRSEDAFNNAYVAIFRHTLEKGVVSQRDLRTLLSPESDCEAFRALNTLCDDFVSFSIEITAAVKLVVSIWRRRGTGQFETDSIVNFRALEPVVQASAAKHIRLLEAEGVIERYNEPTLSPCTTECDSLTKREQQIVEMVFEGHCSESIGHTLNISYGTVKIHKKNIYRKLQISSESELLRMRIGERERSSRKHREDGNGISWHHRQEANVGFKRISVAEVA